MAHQALLITLVALVPTLIRATIPEHEKVRIQGAGYSIVSPNVVGECTKYGEIMRCRRNSRVSLYTRPDRVAGQDWLDNITERLEKMDNFEDVLSTNSDYLSSLDDQWAAEGQTTTLRQVFFIHRHGDRTPISFQEKDDLKNEPFWSFFGYGQLTNRGKARLNLLGRIIRLRYNEFLQGSVNKNFRITRSSGSLRCIESAQAFLSGFLALNIPDSPDAKQLIWDRDNNPLALEWQPASIQSVPPRIDGMLAESVVCKKLMDEYINVIDKSPMVKAINKEFKEEAKILHDQLGFVMDYYYKWFWASSQIEIEKTYFPDKVKKAILDAYPRIERAGNMAMTAYQSTHMSKRLRSGLLIDDILANMKLASLLGTDGVTEAKKFVHYSSHDMNIVSLLGVLGVWDQFAQRPNYGSNIIIELHRDETEWFLKFFYMPDVPAKPQEIHVAKCESLHPNQRCTFENFERSMRGFRVDGWQNWMSECGNDLRGVNPYIPSD